MITMAAEANNDGNNLSGYLKWFSTCLVFYFWVFLGGNQCWWAVFIKLQATVIQAVSR